VRVRLLSQTILILVLSFFRSVDSVLVRFTCLECEFGAFFLQGRIREARRLSVVTEEVIRCNCDAVCWVNLYLWAV
jgi:hypothetical protein